MANPRIRIINLVEIFNVYSDELHIISADELIERLAKYGHNINKRVLIEDIKSIRESGFDIVSVASPKKGFYLARPFNAETMHIIQKAMLSSSLVSQREREDVRSAIERTLGNEEFNIMTNTTINLIPKVEDNDIPLAVVYKLRKAIAERRQALITVAGLEPGDMFSTSKAEEAFVVNPYILGISNCSFSLYFSCPSTPSKPEYIRLRRISSVKLLDCAQNRKSELDINKSVGYFGKVPPFDLAVKSKHLVFRLKTKDIEYIDHVFELPIEYKKDERDGFCLARVNTVFNARLLGCLYYLKDKIELIEPKSLDDII